MAIAYVTRTGKLSDSVTSITQAHAFTGTGALAMLAICDNSNTLTGVTVGGSNATLIDSQLISAGNWVALYYFPNATGTPNVVVTRTGSGAEEIAFICTEYSGAATSSSVPHTTKMTATSTTITNSIDTSVSPSTDNCWHFQWIYSTGSAVTASTGMTDRSGSVISAGQKTGDSNGVISPAGSHSGSWTQSNVLAGTISASIAPVAASGPANLNTKFTGAMLMGVGA